MSDYLFPPLEGDAAAILAQKVARLQARWPDWSFDPDRLDSQILLADSEIQASLNEQGSTALTGIFRYMGLNLIPDAQPLDAVAATATVTITVSDTAGHTIDAETVFGAGDGPELVPFVLIDDAVIAPGDSSVAGQAVVAGVDGTVGNDLSGALQQVDALGGTTWTVTSIVFDAPSADGVDAEADAAYLDRLRDLLGLQAPRPIIADNFAVMARSVPGVGRALAIDGYDPADHASYDPTDPSTWKERYTTVSPIAADGANVSPGELAAVDVLFNGDAAAGIPAKREVNFVVPVVNPTRTTVKVTWSAVAWPLNAPADVEAAGNAALADFLDPSRWGQPSDRYAPEWQQVATLTIDMLYAVLHGVPGIRNVTALTFAEQSGVLGGGPLTLTGTPGPVLTEKGTLVGTVTAP